MGGVAMFWGCSGQRPKEVWEPAVWAEMAARRPAVRAGLARSGQQGAVWVEWRIEVGTVGDEMCLCSLVCPSGSLVGLSGFHSEGGRSFWRVWSKGHTHSG